MEFYSRENIITCGNISINTLAKTVCDSGEIIGLTRKEYGIIEYLAHNLGRVISPEEIIEHVWDSETDLFSNTFKFHIHSLKKKLPSGDLIKNIRGQGYMISDT